MDKDQGRGYFGGHDPYKFTGPDGAHPRSRENLLVPSQGCWDIFCDFNGEQGNSWWLEESKWTTSLQARPEKQCRELQEVILASVPGKLHSESSRNMFLGT